MWKFDLLSLLVSLSSASSVDVADISGDTWCTSDIVERKTGDQWVGLEEEGEGLTDTTWMSLFHRETYETHNILAR